MRRQRGFSSADLEALGLQRGEDGIARPVESKPPQAPRGVLVGIDPSLSHTGLAAIKRSGEVVVDSLKLPARRSKGESEYAFLTSRLELLGEGVRYFMLAYRSAEKTCVVVESAAIFPGTRKDPQSIVKLGIAVGVAFASARAWVDECRVVSPDWTWEVLCHRKRGGASKPERWKAAQAVLLAASLEWPLPPPDAIKLKSDDEHKADALTLLAARIAKGE